MNFEVKNLAFSREHRYLFRKVNFSLSAGDLLHVQGFNGAGKSSLLKILIGLISPQKGHVFWHGKAIHSDYSAFCEKVSYLGHKDGLKKTLTPIENVHHHLVLSGSACNQAMTNDLLQTLDLSRLRNTPCQRLSAGQRRKVALIPIILAKKPLWVLDEPFTALDNESINRLQALFFAHVAQGGMIIMASHIALEKSVKVLNLGSSPC
jgi:heme exporter protein A